MFLYNNEARFQYESDEQLVVALVCLSVPAVIAVL